jgi:hypothetical protein
LRLFQQSKIGRENVGLSTRLFQREGFSGPTRIALVVGVKGNAIAAS